MSFDYEILIMLGVIFGITAITTIVIIVSRFSVKKGLSQLNEAIENLAPYDFSFTFEERKGESYLPANRTTDRTNVVQEKERIYSSKENEKKIVVELEIPVYTAVNDDDRPCVFMQERLSGYKHIRIPLSLWENFKKEMGSCTRVETDAYVIKAKIEDTNFLSLVEKNSRLIDASKFTDVFIDERYNIPLLITGNVPYTDENDKAEFVSKIKKYLHGEYKRALYNNNISDE